MLHILTRSLVLCALLLTTACASSRHNDNDTAQAQEEAEPAVFNPDPFEGFNRKVFAFNLKLDRWVLKPVAKGYDAVAPGFVKTGVSNFFSNLGEITNIVNDALQWKWLQASNDTGRLLLNSTIGIGGLFDVASVAGLEESPGEDFGQTLGRWGFKRGPYIMLPVLGPTTVRDGLGIPVNSLLDPVYYLEDPEARYGLVALRLTSQRADLLEVEKLASGDFYLFVRDTYLQRRDYLERDGEISDSYEDDFGSDEF